MFVEKYFSIGEQNSAYNFYILNFIINHIEFANAVQIIKTKKEEFPKDFLLIVYGFVLFRIAENLHVSPKYLMRVGFFFVSLIICIARIIVYEH